MFALGNSLFACCVRSARERSFEEACGETEGGRRRLPLAPRTRPIGTQTEPQLEPSTSAGVILPETGQFLLLCSLQLWQQLQRCRQTIPDGRSSCTETTSARGQVTFRDRQQIGCGGS